MNPNGFCRIGWLTHQNLRLHLVAVAGEARLHRLHVGKGLDSAGSEFLLGEADELRDHRVEDAAHRLVTHDRERRVGRHGLGGCEMLAPQADLVHVFGPQHERLQPVVDVMAVVGDLVGEVRDLRFETGRGRRIEAADRRPVVVAGVFRDALA